METDLINNIHKRTNAALESKDSKVFEKIFDKDLEYIQADGKILSKAEYIDELEKTFRKVKSIQTSQYRIKSSSEHEIFTEKIARKSVIIKPKMIFLTDKQTIQTEEIFQWKIINGEWKVIKVEVVLEEKY
ncbi:nuclear transport factor 2 family protein [Pedobacter jejuensis]|uniref:Nuclear transport factor 2 family protein n=1 Tax=Pedobacter jejuensis TaxID=1268550 RepID=A0A3N0BLY5_9SPHI|nr:nuclear transport factor 2 family protein [Pedobacter jejuensis]RNL49766.1 nuclear transport factor 2 family protein [Pedobacter jejuensis]